MLYGLARRCGWVVKWGLTDTGNAEKGNVAVLRVAEICSSTAGTST